MLAKAFQDALNKLASDLKRQTGANNRILRSGVVVETQVFGSILSHVVHEYLDSTINVGTTDVDMGVESTDFRCRCLLYPFSGRVCNITVDGLRC